MRNAVQLFPPELRTASIVPRWSVVWTLQRDTVANHSYYVTMYARAVAQVINWNGAHALLMYLALIHDLDETITGDIVSPVKVEIIDAERAAEYTDIKMQERMPGIVRETDIITDCGELNSPTFNWGKLRQCDEAWRIIKVADRLDALLFLISEQRLGNGVIAPRIPSAEARLHGAFMELPETQDRLQELWQTVMLPVIRVHKEEGGNGV